ncbi:PAS domain-containing protein [Streptomyces sp. NPDC056190]|uniref:PAS domain-containing protein n=1 Tax=Streptomyces sp. NPDC056190 TaxID=3345741 RepID=UPI0035DEA71C
MDASKASDTVRFQVLHNIGDGESQAGVLRLALDQAVAELGGLGGMVHLRLASEASPIRLAVTNGLPMRYTQSWKRLDWQEDVAPVRALQSGALEWLPCSDSEERDLQPGTGIAAIPLLNTESGDAFGVLSVITSQIRPSATQHEFLETIATWVSGHINHETDSIGADPTQGIMMNLSEERLQQAHKEAGVGIWSWDIRTGNVTYDDATLAVLRIAPETFDGRVDTFLGIIHPHDIPRVLGTVEQALRQHEEYRAEHRVSRPDGTVGWVETRAQVIVDESGEPIRLAGTVRDMTQKQTSQGSADSPSAHQ